jgi:hypothetical protein
MHKRVGLSIMHCMLDTDLSASWILIISLVIITSYKKSRTAKQDL